MRVISCLGSESSLLMCSHTPLGSTSFCNATNEVGVRCIGMSEVSSLNVSSSQITPHRVT